MIAKEVCQQIDLIKFNDGERYDKIHKGYNIASISDKSSKFIFLAIFQREYPSYKIFSLLEEINNKVNKLVYTDIEEKKNNIQMIMVELHKHYNDPSVISLYYAQQEIKKVNKVIKDQIESIASNIESTEVD